MLWNWARTEIQSHQRNCSSPRKCIRRIVLSTRLKQGDRQPRLVIGMKATMCDRCVIGLAPLRFAPPMDAIEMFAQLVVLRR